MCTVATHKRHTMCAQGMWTIQHFTFKKYNISTAVDMLYSAPFILELDLSKVIHESVMCFFSFLPFKLVVDKNQIKV